MAQVSMTVRMDAALKESFDSLCSDFKIEAPKVKPNGGWEAFEEIRKMAEAGELPDLSAKEINEEIRRYRAGK